MRPPDHAPLCDPTHGSVAIRAARMSDEEELVALSANLRGYDVPEPRAYRQALRRVLQSTDCRLWVAHCESDSPVGYILVSTRPRLSLQGPLVTIDELTVSPARRGQGIGRLLVNAAKAFALRYGAKRLELTSWRGHESYRRQFYPANGFVEFDSAVFRFLMSASARK
jgi:GNAT superfamily N-acetyltransferase